MDKEYIDTQLHFFRDVGGIPVIIKYGDSLWKKRWFNYELISLPGGREYCDDSILNQPEIKSKRGQIVTVTKDGLEFHGVGVVAANLTEVDSKNLYDSLKLILHADPEVAGIAYVTKDNWIMTWIDREIVPDL